MTAMSRAAILLLCAAPLAACGDGGLFHNHVANDAALGAGVGAVGTAIVGGPVLLGTAIGAGAGAVAGAVTGK